MNMITVHGNVVNSPIQQASPHATQTVEINDARTADIVAVLTSIKANMAGLGLTGQSQKDLEAEVATVEAQLQSSHPKPIVVTECFRSIRNIVEGTASGILSTGILAAIAKSFGW